MNKKLSRFGRARTQAAGWRNQVNHRQNQKMGHDKLFDNYRISVGEIVREYTDKNRSEAPAYSNAYLNTK